MRSKLFLMSLCFAVMCGICEVNAKTYTKADVEDNLRRSLETWGSGTDSSNSYSFESTDTSTILVSVLDGKQYKTEL